MKWRWRGGCEDDGGRDGYGVYCGQPNGEKMEVEDGDEGAEPRCGDDGGGDEEISPQVERRLPLFSIFFSLHPVSPKNVQFSI